MKATVLILSLISALDAASGSTLRRTQSIPTTAAVGQDTRLRLVNADTDKPIDGFDPLPATTLIDLSLMPTMNLTIEAVTSGTVGSVQWSYDGATRIVKSPAWVLCGKSGTDFLRCQNFKLGTNTTIAATPFATKNGTGSAGSTALTRIVIFKSYKQVPLPMTLTLINAETGTSFGSLTNATKISLSQTPKVNVLVGFQPSETVGSVTFMVDRRLTRIDSQAPYTLMNSNGTGYLPWTPSIGLRSLLVRAYSGKAGQGTLLSTMSVAFVVEKGTLSPVAATQAPTLAPVETRAPARVPTTPAPTHGPTVSPTQTPTLAPTLAPTRAPTKAPVVQPTTGMALVNFVATTPTLLNLPNGSTSVKFQMTLFFKKSTRPYFIVAANGGQGREPVEDYLVSFSPVAAGSTHHFPIHLNFPRYSHPGRYALSIKLIGADFRSTTIDAVALANLGLPSHVEVEQKSPDIAPPTLLSLEVTPAVAQRPTRGDFYIDLYAAVIDDKSGMRFAQIIVTHVASGAKWYKSPRGDYDDLPPDEVFDVGTSFVVTQSSARGKYTLAVQMRDRELNEVTIESEELLARGLPGAFTIV